MSSMKRRKNGMCEVAIQRASCSEIRISALKRICYLHPVLETYKQGRGFVDRKIFVAPLRNCSPRGLGYTI